MSPVPPPAGTYVPSDDWTEDPSFDLSPSARQLALPPSPSPSHSSTSGSSTSASSSKVSEHPIGNSNSNNNGHHTSSPLRNSFTGNNGAGTLKLKKRGPVQVKDLDLDMDMDADFDFGNDDDEGNLQLSKNNPTSSSSVAELHARRPRSSTASSTSITRTIVGTGPTGVGTITRLGSGSSSASGSGCGGTIKALGLGSVRARAAAVEKSWEADMDFDDITNFDDIPKGNSSKSSTLISRIGSAGGSVSLDSKNKTPTASKVHRVTLSPPILRKAAMPPPDALDELGFDLEDEDQATLKAGATIKAMLPPPRSKNSNSNSNTNTSASAPDHSTLRPKASFITIPPPTPPTQDPDSLDAEEADFALPLNLTNLTLATQPRRDSKTASRPRSSNASTSTATEWDSPASNAHKPSSWTTGTSGWGSEDSPLGGKGKGRSETSATSISDALPETPVENKFRGKDKLIVDENDDDAEEEDMELGLVLPSPEFFSNSRANELNSILDRKRKPQYAPPVAPLSQPALDRRGVGDDSFEDGLVLDEPGVELSRHRLREKKRARDRPSGPPAGMGAGTRRGLSLGGAAKTVAKEREKAWEKQREQGWGRNTPLGFGGVLAPGAGSRERTQSSLGLSLRSNSASAMPTLRETRPELGPGNGGRDSPSMTLTGRERESIRSRSGHIHSLLPPSFTSTVPAPAPATQAQSQAPTPTPTSTRLRHQKSHFHLAPSQTPPSLNLTRKQSLASLQDAIAQGHGQSQSQSHSQHYTGVGDRTLTSLDALPLPQTPHHSALPGSRYHHSTSRLTMPTSSSRAKIRPAISSVFPQPQGHAHAHGHGPRDRDRDREFPTPNSSASSLSSIVAPAPSRSRLDHPASGPRRRDWGDGTELDSIDDLDVGDVGHNAAKHVSGAGLGLGKPRNRAAVHERPTPNTGTVTGTRKKSGPSPGPSASATTSTSGKRTRSRKPAGLIKHLGGAGKKKVVGEMTWNPTTLRWEGNESVLRDFDAISTSSVRPALITHYTGSSVGTGPGLSSPVGASAPAPRIVGDMQFDPIHMRWVSILSPEDDEPDPFEGMADDEDDEFATGRGGTITRTMGRKLVTIGDRGSGFGAGSGFGVTSVTTNSTTGWSSRLASESSIATSHGGSVFSAGGGGSSADDLSLPLESVSEELWNECKAAEERHKTEMKGWATRGSGHDRDRKEKRLWEIRNLAMRS